MNVRSASALVLLSLAWLGTSAPAQAQTKPELQPAHYFPTEVGRQWTYELKITAGKTTRSIIYTTRVIAHQELPDVGVCAVFQSNVKLLPSDWFKADGEAIVNPRRQHGKRVATFPRRVLLDRASLVRLPRLPPLTSGSTPAVPKVAKTEAKTAEAEPPKTGATKTPAKTSEAKTPEQTGPTKPPAKTSEGTPPAKTSAADPSPAAAIKRSWAWRASEPQEAAGVVKVIGRQTLRLRGYGTLDCVVLEDTGTFTVQKDTRTQWRRIWLAPQIGIVREVCEVRAGKTVTFATEAHLMRHE